MYVGLVSGLIDGRHHKRLGAAWMLFCWCVMRQTGQATEGIVCRGATINYDSIAEEMNCSRWNVRNWMQRLIREKYIRLEHEPRGFRIFVANPKKFRVTKASHPQAVQTDQIKSLSCTKLSHPKQVHHFRNKDIYEKLLQNNLLKLLPNNKTACTKFSFQENQERQRQLQSQAEWVRANSKPQPPALGEAESKAFIQSCIDRAGKAVSQCC